jgi:hypothetical protein
MLKIGTLRWKGRCKRHPKYNPAYDGEAAIKGGCRHCIALLEIHLQHARLIQMMRDFGPVRERRTPARARTEGVQACLFE